MFARASKMYMLANRFANNGSATSARSKAPARYIIDLVKDGKSKKRDTPFMIH